MTPRIIINIQKRTVNIGKSCLSTFTNSTVIKIILTLIASTITIFALSIMEISSSIKMILIFHAGTGLGTNALLIPFEITVRTLSTIHIAWPRTDYTSNITKHA